MCVEESSHVIFDEVKVTKKIEIDYDDDLEDMIVKTSTPPQESSGELP